MPLFIQQTQWDCVRQALIGYLNQVQAPRVVLEPLLPPLILAPVPDQPPQAWAEWTVGYLRSEGFSRSGDGETPSIVNVLRQFPTQPDMASLLRNVERQLESHRREAGAAQREAAAIDPFHPILVRRRQPVLARRTAAAALKALALPDDAAAYVVRAQEPKAGCSYTAEIVNFAISKLALSEQRDIQMASVEYSDEMVDRYEAVAFIAGTFFSLIDTRQTQLGRPLANPAPPFERSDKWLNAVGQWVLTAAASTGEPWWLVLDRLPTEIKPADPVKFVDDPVDRFVQILVRKVAKLNSSNRIRLVVLSYASDFPAEVRAAVFREELPSPSTIGQAEVEDLFRKFFGANGGAEDAAVDAAAGRVFELFAKIPPGEHRLPYLNQCIRDVFQGLTGGVQ